MREYATYLGESVNIGTCDDMHCVRADQREGDWSALRLRWVGTTPAVRAN